MVWNAETFNGFQGFWACEAFLVEGLNSQFANRFAMQTAKRKHFKSGTQWL